MYFYLYEAALYACQLTVLKREGKRGFIIILPPREIWSHYGS